MAKFKVQSFKEKQTKAGKTFWLASGLLDDAPEVVTMWTKPEEGKEYEGTTKENDFGVTFSLAGAGGGRGGWNNDPERDNRIIRQNSLQHATARASVLAELVFQTESDKKAAFDLASEYLKPSNIMKAADMFALYSKGELKPGVDKQDVVEAFPGATERPTEEPVSEGPVKPGEYQHNGGASEELPF